jgi:hypothetical protein
MRQEQKIGEDVWWRVVGLPVHVSDEDAEVGAELGERGGRGAAHAASAAEHEHAGLVPLGRGGSGGRGGHGGWRSACSDHGHGGVVGLSPKATRGELWRGAVVFRSWAGHSDRAS